MALVDNLEALLARGQDTALLRYSLGGEYRKLNRLDKAAAHLRKAVELHPQYSAAWKLLGLVLAEAGRSDEAIQTFEDGIKVAETKGDKQAAKEMTVFLKRLRK